MKLTFDIFCFDLQPTNHEIGHTGENDSRDGPHHQDVRQDLR